MANSHRSNKTKISDEGDGGFGKSEWLEGFIGGEVEGAPDRGFGDFNDWDGDDGKLCHEAEFVDGLPIAHDGISDHFKQSKYLRQGHNDVDLSAARRDSSAAMDYASKPSGGFSGADFDEKYEQLRQNRKSIDRSGGT